VLSGTPWALPLGVIITGLVRLVLRLRQRRS
jgi:hypothetical protein